jgi:hypothetical protein
MRIKCKKDFLIDTRTLLTKDKLYYVTEEDDESFYVTDDTGRGLLIYKSHSVIHINCGEFFYTKQEHRKNIIGKLLNEVKV